MEFKANFIGGIIVDFVFYGTHFFFFSIIFSYVDSLLEFTQQDVMIFLIITFLSDTFMMMFFSGNLMKLNQLILKGDLDFFLLKPISSQFLVSFRYVKSYAIISIIILGTLLLKLCIDSPRDIAFINQLNVLMNISNTYKKNSNKSYFEKIYEINFLSSILFDFKTLNNQTIEQFENVFIRRINLSKKLKYEINYFLNCNDIIYSNLFK